MSIGYDDTGEQFRVDCSQNMLSVLFPHSYYEVPSEKKFNRVKVTDGNREKIERFSQLLETIGVETRINTKNIMTTL